jgi:predicted nucleic acid-binding protein
LIELLVVDANPLLSALLGGRAREILFCGRSAFFSPQATLFEVEKYLPFVAQKLDRAELDLFREFELLPVTAVQPHVYESELGRATELIGWRDPKDVPVLALAVRLRLPVWTEDRDFENIPGVSVYKTADLLPLAAR